MAAGALGQRPGSDRGRYTRTHTVMHFQSTLRGFLEHFTPSTTTFIFSVKSTGVVSQGKEPPTIPHMPECTLKPTANICMPQLWRRAPSNPKRGHKSKDTADDTVGDISSTDSQAPIGVADFGAMHARCYGTHTHCQLRGGGVQFQVGQFFEPLGMSRRDFPWARHPSRLRFPSRHS